MDVPAIREGGDVTFSTSFGERGQRSQLSITNQIKHPFLFLTTLGWSLSVLAAAREQVRERGMEGKSLLCFSLLLLQSLPTPHCWWCPQPWPQSHGSRTSPRVCLVVLLLPEEHHLCSCGNLSRNLEIRLFPRNVDESHFTSLCIQRVHWYLPVLLSSPLRMH